MLQKVVKNGKVTKSWQTLPNFAKNCRNLANVAKWYQKVTKIAKYCNKLLKKMPIVSNLWQTLGQFDKQIDKYC